MLAQPPPAVICRRRILHSLHLANLGGIMVRPANPLNRHRKFLLESSSPTRYYALHTMQGSDSRSQFLKGCARTLVLRLLTQRPMYGYEIATALAHRSDGIFA